MPSKKAMLAKSVDALLDKSGGLRRDRQGQHASAHKFEVLGHALVQEVAEIRDDIVEDARKERVLTALAPCV